MRTNPNLIQVNRLRRKNVKIRAQIDTLEIILLIDVPSRNVTERGRRQVETKLRNKIRQLQLVIESHEKLIAMYEARG